MRHVVLGLLLAFLVGAGQVTAQSPAEPTPDQVKSLLQLLSDPVVKTWIAREMQAPEAALAPAAPRTSVEAEAATFFEAHLAALKVRLESLAAAVPRLPQELVAAEERLFADLEATGWVRVGLLLAVFLGLGYGCEWLFWRATGALREQIMASPLDTPATRVGTVLARLGYGLASVLAFALGSIGAFLVLSWPPSLRALILGYLLAFLVLRLGMVLARFLWAPHHPRFRVVPMSDRTGSLWYRATIAFVLVCVRIRHHPAAAPVRRVRASGADPGIPARPRAAGDRLAPDLARGWHDGRAHRRHDHGGADLPDLGGRGAARDVGAGRGAGAAGGAPRSQAVGRAPVSGRGGTEH